MPTFARRAAALAVFLAAGCAAIDPNNLLSRQAAPAGKATEFPVPAPARLPLGAQGRAAALDFVWTTVNERYYDPKLNGVDWNAARERWRPRALAAPDDDGVLGPPRPHDRRAARLAHARGIAASAPRRSRATSRSTLGLRLPAPRRQARGDGRESGVGRLLGRRAPGHDARGSGRGARAGRLRRRPSAKARDGLHRAGEAPLRPRAASSRASPERARSSPSRAATARPSPCRSSAGVPPAPPRVTHRVLPSGFGYIRLTSWAQSLQGPMIAAIEALKDTPGLVIDLRGNPGGSALMVRTSPRNSSRARSSSAASSRAPASPSRSPSTGSR